VTVHVKRTIIGDMAKVETMFDHNNPPVIFFDTNVWRGMNDAKLTDLKRLQQSYGFRYRYSVTNFVELVSHLEDQPFGRVQSWFRRIHQLCDPEILPSAEMVLLSKARLNHYIDPIWIPIPDQIALAVKLITDTDNPTELINILNLPHYKHLRAVDKNSMAAIMGELDRFKPPIKADDNLMRWFLRLCEFFLFVRSTRDNLFLKSLLREEQERFVVSFMAGSGKIFMTHCMKLVQKTVNDGRKVYPNDLYDLLQLILLEDDNTLFVTNERAFFYYESERVLRWAELISCT